MSTVYQKQKASSKIRCPKCGSYKIASCPGGSNLKVVIGIKWICSECLFEW
jgi:predicted RNA-binding Zn-ribbon protein involved in translation (DUF1610 family)